MNANTVTVTDTTLIVQPHGLDKIWAFRDRVEVPLEHVKGATFDPGMKHEPKGWRGPGLRLPGKLAGTFHADGERQFWNVTGFEQTVVIELDPSEHFTRLIITVEDPHTTVEAINRAVHP